MADQTAIAWADRTHNHWEGCQKVGPGCDHCYAEARNARFGGGTAPNWGPGAPRRLTSLQNRQKPLRWQREAEADGSRPFVFCSSLADVFDNAVDVAWRSELFELIRSTPNLVWLLLTKRVGIVERLFLQMPDAHPWPTNAWLGATVVNQEEADRDVPKLMAAKTSMRIPKVFLSMEPLLGPVSLLYPPSLWPDGAPMCCDGSMCGCMGMPVDPPLGWGVDWIIVGGESGPNARPMEAVWADDLRGQSETLRATFLFKQMGGRTADKGGHFLNGQAYLDRPTPPPLERIAA